MKRAVLVLFLAGLSVSAAAQSCPYDAPPYYSMSIEMAGCSSACPDSAAVEVGLEPVVTMFGYYELQPWDQVTWDFGDGSAPVTTPIGTGKVTYAWPIPGNYTITATLRNACGSVTFERYRYVIASDPAKLSWPRMPDVSETAGTFSIPIRRTGNMSRRVSARLIVAPELAWMEPVFAPADIPIVFEPGESEHVVTLPVRDNLLYDGPRDMQWEIRLGYPQGGVFLENGRVFVVDNEPQPRLVCDDVSVVEGDRGRTRVVIPCHLTAPLALNATLHAWIQEGSATKTDFYEHIDYDSKELQIARGTLSGAISVNVYGDTEVEANEQFTLRLDRLSWNWNSYYDRPPTITILNDDAALTSVSRSVDPGQRVDLTLVPGRQYDSPTDIPLQSSNPTALAVPASVKIAPGAYSVKFFADALAPGASTISANLGARTVSADVTVRQPAAIGVSTHALTLLNGATARVRISVSPARATPLVVRLTSDARVVSVPAEATIPPGGEAAIDVRAVGVGETAIGITAQAEAVAGTSVTVNAAPAPAKRRAAR